MQYRKLGSSNLNVSEACLGTMTWGKQNTEAEGHAQINVALDHGVNFMDTAEMYAVPPSEETYGKTEEIIGTWIEKNQAKRDKIVIMTKIAGPGMAYVRDGNPISAKTIMPALDASLKRLKTDYIDVYQLHWPNRQSPTFGRHAIGKIDLYAHDIEETEAETLAILQTLDEAVKAGKIRYCGLSNETPWGIDLYCRLAKAHNLPKMVSIQNEFSLLHTKDYPFVVEACINQDIAYLPWSALGSGVLTGKYLNKQRPEGSRWTMINRHGNFRDTPQVEAAVKAYLEIAAKHNISPAQLAYAWCNAQPWVTSTIIGATSLPQLEDNLAAFEMSLSAEIVEEINVVQRAFSVPF